MTEGPIVLPTHFTKYPLKRLYLITIKDNSQTSSWIKIGKANDWIRRYSEDYYIVKGTNGGIHFHILAGVKKDPPDFRFQKGIHFHTACLSSHVSSYSPDDEHWRREANDLRCRIQSNLIDKYQSELHIKNQELLKLLCIDVHKYFARIRQKESRVKAKTKKDIDLQRVIDYLDKNLSEPRDDSVRLYTDYINKFKHH